MPRLSTRFDWTKVILELRMRGFLTQKELAHEVGCTAATVGKWERGETEPKPATLRALHAYGKSVGYPAEQWAMTRAGR